MTGILLRARLRNRDTRISWALRPILQAQLWVLARQRASRHCETPRRAAPISDPPKLAPGWLALPWRYRPCRKWLPKASSRLWRQTTCPLGSRSSATQLHTWKLLSLHKALGLLPQDTKPSYSVS